MDMIHAFDHGAALYPQRPCFVSGDTSYTYQEVRQLTERIAYRLHALDAGNGRQSGILSPNHATAFACVLGSLRAGNRWVPLNPRNTALEQAQLLQAFDVEVLFFHSAMEPVIAAIRGQLAKVQHLVCIDRDSEHAPSLQQWLEDAPCGPLRRSFKPDDCAVIAATGGTTGQPKGVMLSHRNIETFVATFMCCAPASDSEPPVHLVVAPMTHAAGILCFPMMARGGINILMDKPDPQSILAAVEKYRVTDLFLPPTLIYMLLAQPNVRDFDYSSLRYLVYGAAPMSTTKLRQAIEIFGPVMTQAFGQTEAPMICCFMGPQEHVDASDLRLSSCGRPTPFTEVGLMDDDGNLLADGETGEIVVRGDLVMLGYLRNREATEEASRFGWHHTGDIGYRDAGGYLHIVDRKKDMIITGGFNVYSSEVEQALLSHPSVQDCAVIGVPDEKWGEAVKAVVQLKPGQSTDETALQEHCKALIGSVKSPKTVEIWPDLPRSTIGKVLKRDIRQRYWAGHARAVV